MDLEFDQVLQAVKEQSLHEVFVRQAPRTLFVVNATVLKKKIINHSQYFIKSFIILNSSWNQSLTNF